MSDTQKFRIPIHPLAWSPDDPAASELDLVKELISEVSKSGWKPVYAAELQLEATKAGEIILGSSPETAIRILPALIRHMAHYDALARKVRDLAENSGGRFDWHHSPEWEAIWVPRQICAETFHRLNRRKLVLSDEDLTLWADWILADNRFFALVPGDAWADAVNEDLTRMDETSRSAWLEILKHAALASGARPSAKWSRLAKVWVKTVGPSKFRKSLEKWLGLGNAKPTLRTLQSTWHHRDGGDTFHDDNATCLRGLLWMAPEVATPDLIRTIGHVTTSCYRKIPGVGPRAVKVANAGVYALSQINDPAAVGQLALLKVKVKFGTAQKEIDKAFTAAAERSGLPRDEIEEMSVPTYGLSEVGVCEEKFDEFTARLKVTGTTTTEIEWLKPDGALQRAIPSVVKTAHKNDLKELQSGAKDIQCMLPAQRERIDSLFLQQKTWPLSVWKERYLNHPLIGTLARRILWEFQFGGNVVTGIWFADQVVDLDLRPINFADTTSVQLWHPINRSTEEVGAWRSFLDAQRIQQPFKQAHREVYPLTEAE
jgi:hypothetical protein